VSDTAAAPNNRAIAFQGKATRERGVGKLNAAKRNKLPAKDFAGPGRSYPDEDTGHARDALARVSGNGSPEVKAEVRGSVAKKYPGMAVDRLKKAGRISDKQAAKRGF
jgi:hypothetical protein